MRATGAEILDQRSNRLRLIAGRLVSDRREADISPSGLYGDEQIDPASVAADLVSLTSISGPVPGAPPHP